MLNFSAQNLIKGRKKRMSISEQFEEFIDYLSAEKNISNHTKANYTSDFKIFLNFLYINGIKPDLQTITTPIIRKYLAYLKNEKDYKNQTMRRKIHSLSSFFKFLLEQEYIEKNPMNPVHAPKLEGRIPIYLSKEEVELLISTAMKYGKENALHDKCFLKTIAFTGMRRQEALALNWEDIDFGKSVVKIKKGKGKKERIVPLPESLSSDLWAYLQTRLPLSTQAVFISNAGNRLTPSPAQSRFNKYIKKAGLSDKGYTLHKLRHSYASLLIQNNADLLSVQKLLGHSDLNSTKIYTHVNTEHLKKQVDKLPFK